MEENKEENITDIEQITPTTAPHDDIQATIEDEETLEKPKPPKKPRTDKQIAAFEKAKVALKVKRENEKAHKLANKKPRGRPRQVKEAPEEPPPIVENNENIKYKKKPKQTKYIMSESDSSSEEEEVIVVKKKERRKPKKRKPPKVVYVSQSESDTDSDYDRFPDSAPLQEPQGPIDHFGGMSFV
jgi:hypothetical protein